MFVIFFENDLNIETLNLQTYKEVYCILLTNENRRIKIDDKVVLELAEYSKRKEEIEINLEKQEIYQAYLRVQELVKRLDQIVKSEAEPAAIFLAENFSNEQH